LRPSSNIDVGAPVDQYLGADIIGRPARRRRARKPTGPTRTPTYFRPLRPPLMCLSRAPTASRNSTTVVDLPCLACERGMRERAGTTHVSLQSTSIPVLLAPMRTRNARMRAGDCHVLSLQSTYSIPVLLVQCNTCSAVPAVPRLLHRGSRLLSGGQ
jgi:hypothetical protein